MLMPRVPSAISAAISQMTKLAMLFNSAPSVSARWVRRRLGSSSLVASARGVRREERRRCTLPSRTEVVKLRMTRRTSRLTTNARTRMKTILAGRASSMSARRATAALSVA